jgi:hypothetical protein
MLRKLLTLFVLLSGLAAVGAPAQARVAAFDEVRLEMSSSLSSQCVATHRQGDMHLAQGLYRIDRTPGMCPRPVVTIRVPTVMLGIDRSRQ